MRTHFLLFCLLTLLLNYNVQSQNHSDSIIKDFKLLKIEKIVFSLNGSIENIDSWVTLFQENKSFVTKFCENCSDSVFIRISTVKQIDFGLYKFSVRRRPLRLETFISPHYCYYYVRVGIKGIMKQKEILDIYLGECEI